MSYDTRKAVKFSKIMLDEIKKMKMPLTSHMAYFFRPKSFAALCELCTRLKNSDLFKKNKSVLNLASLHDPKKWAKKVRAFPKRYPNHRSNGTLIIRRVKGEIVNGKKVLKDYVEKEKK